MFFTAGVRLYCVFVWHGVVVAQSIFLGSGDPAGGAAVLSNTQANMYTLLKPRARMKLSKEGRSGQHFRGSIHSALLIPTP